MINERYINLITNFASKYNIETLSVEKFIEDFKSSLVEVEKDSIAIEFKEFIENGVENKSNGSIIEIFSNMMYCISIAQFNYNSVVENFIGINKLDRVAINELNKIYIESFREVYFKFCKLEENLFQNEKLLMFKLGNFNEFFEPTSVICLDSVENDIFRVNVYQIEKQNFTTMPYYALQDYSLTKFLEIKKQHQIELYKLKLAELEDKK